MVGRLEQQLSVMSPEEEEARQSLRTQYEAPLHTAHPYHSHMCASRSFVLRHTRSLCHALLTQERRSCMSRRDQSAQMCAVCTVHWSHARHTLPSPLAASGASEINSRGPVVSTVWVRGCRLVWLSSMRSSRSGGRRRLCTCTNPSQEGHTRELWAIFRLQRSQTICAAKSHSSHSWTRSSHLRATHTSAMHSSSTCPRRTPLPSTSSAPLPLPSHYLVTLHLISARIDSLHRFASFTRLPTFSPTVFDGRWTDMAPPFVAIRSVTVAEVDCQPLGAGQPCCPAGRHV